MSTANNTKRPQGFAAMQDRERLCEIARKGGKAAHSAGKAHKWTHEEAVLAGKKGAAARLARMKEKKNNLGSIENDRPTVPSLSVFSE